MDLPLHQVHCELSNRTSAVASPVGPSLEDSRTPSLLKPARSTQDTSAISNSIEIRVTHVSEQRVPRCRV